MRNQPLLLSILLGVIIVLVIAGISLSVRLNTLSKSYYSSISQNMELERNNQGLKEEKEALLEKIDKLKREIITLQEKVKRLETDNTSLKEELERTKKLKDKLEENLKEELL